MSSFRSFKTTYARSREQNWAPLAAVSRLSRLSSELHSFHPGEFMCMACVENRRKGVAIWLYKHYDTRCYINLDAAGHAYEFCYDEEQWQHENATTENFGGRYRLHRSLEHAVWRLRLWEFEHGPKLGRSFPPEQWPADPDDWAIGAYMNGGRYAWMMAHSVDGGPVIQWDADEVD